MAPQIGLDGSESVCVLRKDEKDARMEVSSLSLAGLWQIQSEKMNKDAEKVSGILGRPRGSADQCKPRGKK